MQFLSHRLQFHRCNLWCQESVQCRFRILIPDSENFHSHEVWQRRTLNMYCVQALVRSCCLHIRDSHIRWIQEVCLQCRLHLSLLYLEVPMLCCLRIHHQEVCRPCSPLLCWAAASSRAAAVCCKRLTVFIIAYDLYGCKYRLMLSFSSEVVT